MDATASRQPDWVSEDGTVRLYHGDALDVLPTLDAQGVDACVCDPPYCSGGQFRSEIAKPSNEKYGGWSHSPGETRKPSAFYSAFSGDNKDGRVFLAWCREWMSSVVRVCKDGAFLAVTTDWRQLPAMADMMQFADWTWRGIVTWDKRVGRPVQGRFRNHVEYVLWGSRGGFEGEDGVYVDSLYSEAPPTHKTRTHVTEKPVGLMKHVMSVLPNDITVIDPFMGSGTTAIACIETGRRFIGIEKEQVYYEHAKRRIEAFQSQALFAGAAA